MNNDCYVFLLGVLIPKPPDDLISLDSSMLSIFFSYAFSSSS